MQANTAWILSNAYTKETVEGAGAIKGKDGKDGVSVVASFIDTDGHLIQKLSDGTFIDAGKLPGGGDKPDSTIADMEEIYDELYDAKGSNEEDMEEIDEEMYNPSTQPKPLSNDMQEIFNNIYGKNANSTPNQGSDAMKEIFDNIYG